MLRSKPKRFGGKKMSRRKLGIEEVAERERLKKESKQVKAAARAAAKRAKAEAKAAARAAAKATKAAAKKPKAKREPKPKKERKTRAKREATTGKRGETVHREARRAAEGHVIGFTREDTKTAAIVEYVADQGADGADPEGAASHFGITIGAARVRLWRATLAGRLTMTSEGRKKKYHVA
jgi:hypothetical protein